MLQLAGKTYQGTFEYVMGTHLYFEDDDGGAPPPAPGARTASGGRSA